MKKVIIGFVLVLVLFLTPKSVSAAAYDDCIKAACGANYQVVGSNNAVQGSCEQQNARECNGAVKAGDTTFPSNPVYSQTPNSVINAINQYDKNQDYNAQVDGLFRLTDLISSAGVMITGATKSNGQAMIPGAVGFFGNGIATLASVPPASANDYVKYMASRIQIPGTPQTAYAAGIGGEGFTSLQPVLALWTVFRNLAYIVFAFLFVVIGIMIMFRIKIDPKTVASIQNALPKIVFALILVSFSYAIAGFLVDIMYVSIALLLTILKSVNNISGFAGSFEKELLGGQTIFHFFLQGVSLDPNNPNLVGTGGVAVSASAFVAISQIVAKFLTNVPVVGALNNVQVGGVGIVGGLFGALAFLIVAIAILWALFRTWLMLLGAYVQIILMIIFAPLQLMLDAIPGQNQFGTWVKVMLSNLLTFPVVVALMFVGTALSTSNAAISPQTGFVPPLIGGNSQTAIQALIGIGVLLTIPKVLEILQELLKTPKFKFGTAWMEAVKFGANPFGAYGTGYNELYDRIFGAGISARQENRAAWAKYYGGVLDPYGTPYQAPNRPTNISPWWVSLIPRAKCLAEGILISTPDGALKVEEITTRTMVWSLDENENKVAVPVAQVTMAQVFNHDILHLILSDKRELFVSPGHPAANGSDMAALKSGDQYDGAIVISNQIERYQGQKTYDLLPDSPKGVYWANGILIGSTLKRK